MTAAGDLTDRLQFERREEKQDGYGNAVAGDWIPQFERWAKIRARRGGEGILAARLEARQPAVVTIRYSRAAAAITADWRAVEMIAGRATGRVFNIRENPVRTDDRAYLEMLVESGVAT